jgi:hypothetical protein
MKVVINKCYGGFGLSNDAYERLIALGITCRPYSKEEEDNNDEVIYKRDANDAMDLALKRFSKADYWDCFLDQNRRHPLLVQVVEELQEKANSHFSELKVVEIPDGTRYEINDYDGIESIHECHMEWS